MKYFAKYLPVEGRGDKGCKWQWFNNIKDAEWEDITPSDMDAIIAHGLKPEPRFRKLKLFLCSRDINLHEKCYLQETVNGELQEVVPNQIHAELRKKCFVKIGEISPEATWVKEGDEFEEGDYRIRWYSLRAQRFTPHGDYEPSDEYTNLGEGRKYGHTTTYVQIKGPCGHFH